MADGGFKLELGRHGLREHYELVEVERERRVERVGWLGVARRRERGVARRSAAALERRAGHPGGGAVPGAARDGTGAARAGVRGGAGRPAGVSAQGEPAVTYGGEIERAYLSMSYQEQSYQEHEVAECEQSGSHSVTNRAATA